MTVWRISTLHGVLTLNKTKSSIRERGLSVECTLNYLNAWAKIVSLNYQPKKKANFSHASKNKLCLKTSCFGNRLWGILDFGIEIKTKFDAFTVRAQLHSGTVTSIPKCAMQNLRSAKLCPILIGRNMLKTPISLMLPPLLKWSCENAFFFYLHTLSVRGDPKKGHKNVFQTSQCKK